MVTMRVVSLVSAPPSPPCHRRCRRSNCLHRPLQPGSITRPCPAAPPSSPPPLGAPRLCHPCLCHLPTPSPSHIPSTSFANAGAVSSPAQSCARVPLTVISALSGGPSPALPSPTRTIPLALPYHLHRDTSTPPWPSKGRAREPAASLLRSCGCGSHERFRLTNKR